MKGLITFLSRHMRFYIALACGLATVAAAHLAGFDAPLLAGGDTFFLVFLFLVYFLTRETAAQLASFSLELALGCPLANPNFPFVTWLPTDTFSEANWPVCHDWLYDAGERHVAVLAEGEVAGVLSEGVRRYALDPESAKALWAKSEEMVGETF